MDSSPTTALDASIVSGAGRDAVLLDAFVAVAEHYLAGGTTAVGIAQTGFPCWDGRSPDYDQFVYCLMAEQDYRQAVR